MAAERPTSGERPSFEDRLAALEAVVRDLEGEDLGLEASLERYREGVDHLRACRSLLDNAESRLAELVGTDPPSERALEVGDEGLRAATDGEG